MNRADAYAAAMADAAATYAPVLDALKRAGLDAFMQQTGGMCLAVEVKLDDLDAGDPRHAFVWVADLEGPLPWEGMDEVEGFSIAYYGPENAIDGSPHPEEFWPRDIVDVPTVDLDALVTAVKDLLAKERT